MNVQSAPTAAKKLQALRYVRGSFEILNQLKLPHIFEYEKIENSEQGFLAIQAMKVRGAPAIAIAAVLSLAVEIHNRQDLFSTVDELVRFLTSRLDYLGKSRPTAVNLFQAIYHLKTMIAVKHGELPNNGTGAHQLIQDFLRVAEEMVAADEKDNRAIGKFGADALIKNFELKKQLQALAQDKIDLKILTHCNTGSLATAAYGTALGVIRTLHERGCLAHAYATETRPYNQGARLTAFELVYEKIPATLIADSMAAFLMSQKNIDGIVVGADRVVANGDTANKIGTYQLSILAQYHNIPFYVAAPSTSIDCTLPSGGHIQIEERPGHELTHIQGLQIAAEGINVWNPSFDVTPAHLISGIITELGVIEKDEKTQTFEVRKFLERNSPVGAQIYASV